MIKEIPIEEYIEMFEKSKGCRRYDAPRVDPIMKTMTVIGKSGEGTKFANEYERMMDEYHNPKLPISIQYWDKDGLTIYVPKKKENK